MAASRLRSGFPIPSRGAPVPEFALGPHCRCAWWFPPRPRCSPRADRREFNKHAKYRGSSLSSSAGGSRPTTSSRPGRVSAGSLRHSPMNSRLRLSGGAPWSVGSRRTSPAAGRWGERESGRHADLRPKPEGTAADLPRSSVGRRPYRSPPRRACGAVARSPNAAGHARDACERTVRQQGREAFVVAGVARGRALRDAGIVPTPDSRALAGILPAHQNGDRRSRIGCGGRRCEGSVC